MTIEILNKINIKSNLQKKLIMLEKTNKMKRKKQEKEQLRRKYKKRWEEEE